MKLTVDASVVVKWFVPESRFEEARLLLAQPLHLHAPDILLAEFANTIWKKARRGEIADVQPYLDELAGLSDIVALHPMHELIARAGEIAIGIDHPVYDCLYLACAEATGSMLVTADRRFAYRASKSFPNVEVRCIDEEGFAAELMPSDRT